MEGTKYLTLYNLFFIFLIELDGYVVNVIKNTLLTN